jgi:hypothetical protein
MNSAVPPEDSICREVSIPPSVSMSAMITGPDSWPSRSAIARPIPDAAPVTIEMVLLLGVICLHDDYSQQPGQMANLEPHNKTENWRVTFRHFVQH